MFLNYLIDTRFQGDLMGARKKVSDILTFHVKLKMITCFNNKIGEQKRLQRGCFNE